MNLKNGAVPGVETPGYSHLSLRDKTYLKILKALPPVLLPLFWLALIAAGAVPPPEQLLPADTLMMVTVPDFSKLSGLYRKSPQSAFWNDAAMKPFKDKFLTKWKEEFLQPLERDLGVKFNDYAPLLQGQLTFALTQNGWQGKESQPLGMLLLLDTRDKCDQLKVNLADLRKKWIDAGKPIRTEKIRDLEFSVLSISSNDVPKTLRKLFPPAAQVQEAPVEGETPKEPPKNEWVVGQAGSLLILGSATKVVEKVVIRLAGGAMPSLGELADYDASRQALFRDAPFYGWVNMKTIVEVLTRKAAEKKDGEPQDPFVPVNSDKIVSATGLGGLKTIAFTCQSASEGMSLQLSVGVPDSSRQGLFKALAGEPKETAPPPFIPADAAKFQRWRLDGQKAWSALEKMLADISPQVLAGLNFALDAANNAAKEKDPGFDVKMNFIGNLGDDIITYQKAAHGGTAAELRSPPSLYLVGSPNPQQLAAAWKNILLLLNQVNGQSGTPAEREFLGRKIFSAPVPVLPLPLPDAPRPSGPRTLHYAASGGYVALSTDASLLEEYLRSSESQGKALRETAGLAEATQRVMGPGTSLFGYENQAETMRAEFEALRKESSSSSPAAVSPWTTLLSPLGFGIDIKSWMDFSLLPPFDKIAKYFSFSVYAGSANVDGLSFKMFAPAPPAANAEASKR